MSDVVTVIAGTTLFAQFGLLGFILRGQNNKINDKAKTQDEKIEKLETKSGEHITNEKHGLVCENAGLKMREHITQEMTTLKDLTFKELREIKTLIKNGDG